MIRFPSGRAYTREETEIFEGPPDPARPLGLKPVFVLLVYAPTPAGYAYMEELRRREHEGRLPASVLAVKA